MRRRYDEVQANGAEIVVIGTGDVRYARDFVDQEDIPFPVLADDRAEAAIWTRADDASETPERVGEIAKPIPGR